jgi:hypothetical protein
MGEVEGSGADAEEVDDVASVVDGVVVVAVVPSASCAVLSF